MKPNFKEMTRKELIAYIKKHRTDDKAINELFVNRRDPNVKVYPATMSIEEMTQVIREKIRQKDQQE